MTEDRAAPIHLDLDDRFYRRVEAAPFPQHILRSVSYTHLTLPTISDV